MYTRDMLARLTVEEKKKTGKTAYFVIITTAMRASHARKKGRQKKKNCA